MKVFIYGGGLGTRMYPYTKKYSKMLLSIFSESIIRIQLNLLAKWGINKFGIIYSKDIWNEINELARSSPDIYIEHQMVPPKHVEAWKYISSNLEDQVIVMNADIIISEKWIKELANIYLNTDVIFVACKDDVVEKGQEGQKIWYILDDDKFIADYSLEYIQDYESANTIGISVIRKAAFNKSCDFRNVEDVDNFWNERFVPNILNNNTSSVLEKNYFWKDVGTWECYRQIHFDIMDKKVDGLSYLLDEYVIWGNRVCVHKTVELDRKRFRFENCVIKENVELEDGVTIVDSIIGKNVIIGEKCSIQNSIILDNCKIAKNSVISNKIIFENEEYDFGE